MAVKADHRLAKEFWPSFSRGAAILIIVLQVIILIAVAALLYFLGFFESNPLAFASTLVAQTILGVVASVIIYKFVARPIKDLLAAIIHVAGEPTNTTPPNPNDKRFEKSGFKSVLQTIYLLASNDTPDTPVPAKVASSESVTAVATPPALIEAALNETICGFVVLNHERKITFSNRAAPTTIDQNGTSSLSLLFNGEDTLNAWLDVCEKSA
ncbi:MAG: hypothetical protein WA030_01690, partial [Candidatus Microsaccharimonas sp.]